MNTVVKICNKIIEYSFYALFFTIPLVFTGSTSELFEFNKMWITYGLTILIAASWITKMILEKRVSIQKTPLDIPIFLFLFSQAISTIFSIDTHISVWGYYSRFNGGLLSLISYIFLYYAFVSNYRAFDHDELSVSNPHKKRHSTSVRIILFLLGLILFPLAILLSAPPSSDPIAAKPIILFIAMIIALFLFIRSYPLGFLKRVLLINLTAGLIVVLWGLPSHFGFDPTCLLFRGTFDVSCWNDQFQPRVRIFSTLGQPNWMAAYLAILIPLAIALGIQKTQNTQYFRNSDKSDSLKIRHTETLFLRVFRVFWNWKTLFFLFSFLFYVSLLYTSSQSGFLGFAVGFALFVVLYFLKNKEHFKPLIYIIGVLLVITFFVGTPIWQLNQFTFPELKNRLVKNYSQSPQPPQKPKANVGPALESGGTESGKIRKIVWQGAVDIWEHNVLFGTGVETYAFAYYKYRPAAHNLTSEWDYLYNKAHNEYLNYLATTGAFGLGTYLLMIGWFLFVSFTKTGLATFAESFASFRESKETKPEWNFLLTLALLAGYISILVSNFFGFSVVIVNLYLFFIPAFVFIINNSLNKEAILLWPRPKHESFPAQHPTGEISLFRWLFVLVIALVSLYLLYILFAFWEADKYYALGYNYDRVGQYQIAHQNLTNALSLRDDEPVFKDELSVNDSILASAFLQQKQATQAALFAQEAIKLNDENISQHPNNLLFWKSRVRIFYSIGQVDYRYLPNALKAIQKANALAPTDAKISYNLGLLYGQTDDFQNAINTLEQTIKLKPDYRDAYYALGLFYHESAVDKNGKVVNPQLQQKATDTLQYILTHLSADDKQTKDSLKSWGVNPEK